MRSLPFFFANGGFISLLFCLLLSLSAVEDERPDRPNIVMILVDDLGWQDVGCYDIDEPSPMETPNIDQLAKRGVQYWQAYSPAPTCAPSRAAILSGIHPARAQMTHVSGGKPPAPHHPKGWTMMSPWYSARMPSATVTIAEVLKDHGYVTGHSGKWHVAMNHHGYPQPEDQGFDYTRNSRGVQQRMHPDRLTGFATSEADDPFRLDANGYPFDQTHADAMSFLKASHGDPFFLYYATWLVHSPLVMRSEKMLRKYENKLGVTLTDEHKTSWKQDGQTNPFYCAMVEQLDYYLGQLFDFIENTEDPRWPGHRLSENTYIILTSDNGGMRGSPNEVYTDNTPLRRGKISVREGGTRVPLIIAGPGIEEGVTSDVMINGLDFYPTIVSLTGATMPQGKQLDGLDLTNSLMTDPTDPSLLREADGTVRDTMLWHFPNSAELASTIRVGDYKLIRNYNFKESSTPELELYRLYDSANSTQRRVDIEEVDDLTEKMPELAQTMNQRLTEILNEMEASYPYFNPHAHRAGNRRRYVPKVLSHELSGKRVVFKYRLNGAKLKRANLIYTDNGGDRFEEWFRTPAEIRDESIVAELPERTTHYLINLIDENNFLVSYPEVDEPKRRQDNKAYSDIALEVD